MKLIVILEFRGFNLPPKKGDKSQSLSRSFRDFLLYTQPPKKRERSSNEEEKETKNAKTGDGKYSKRRKAIDKMESPRDDKEDEEPLRYKKKLGESTEQYILRINEEANKRLISAHKKVASTSTKRKE